MSTLFLKFVSLDNFLSLSFILLMFTAIQFIIQSSFKRFDEKYIETFKVITGSNLERKNKFTEREYSSTSECWLQLMKTEKIMREVIYPTCLEHDFDNMDKKNLDLFFKEYNLSDTQIYSVENSINKSKVFLKCIQLNEEEKAKECIELFKNTLYANEIFMKENVYKKFDHFLYIFQVFLQNKIIYRITSDEEMRIKSYDAIEYLISNRFVKDRNDLLNEIKKNLQREDHDHTPKREYSIRKLRKNIRIVFKIIKYAFNDVFIAKHSSEMDEKDARTADTRARNERELP